MQGNPFRRRPLLIPGLIAAIFLLIAMGRHPYDYYVLMRWVVFVAAIYIAYQSSLMKWPWAIWCFAVIGLLFNPIVPVQLSRGTWQPLDILAAIVFIAGGIVLTKRDDMFRFVKQENQQRESFESFLAERISLNLEKVLKQYITKYNMGMHLTDTDTRCSMQGYGLVPRYSSRIRYGVS